MTYGLALALSFAAGSAIGLLLIGRLDDGFLSFYGPWIGFCGVLWGYWRGTKA